MKSKCNWTKLIFIDRFFTLFFLLNQSRTKSRFFIVSFSCFFYFEKQTLLLKGFMAIAIARTFVSIAQKKEINENHKIDRNK